MPAPPVPLLEARGVVVSRGGRKILDGASLAVHQGAALCVQGPSGSGKSTLARVLATLSEPDEGVVLLGGVDARRLPPTVFRRRVAFLAQQPVLFGGTVRDNLDEAQRQEEPLGGDLHVAHGSAQTLPPSQR